jgi:RecA-family ATPase
MIDADQLNAFVREQAEPICRHFFPLGKKDGHEWKIGDVSGKEGNSLGIELEGDKAGLCNDRAGGFKGNLIKLIGENRGLNYPRVADEVGRTFGVSFSLNGASDFDWGKLERLNSAYQRRLAEWRRLQREFVGELVAHDLVRLFKYCGQLCWAFPIHAGGRIGGCHYRPINVDEGKRTDWGVYPTQKNGGPGMQPLVIGNLDKALRAHISESTWDALALCDPLGIDLGGASEDVLFCTRGAATGKFVDQIPETIQAIYVWPQNDQAGQDWLRKVSETLRRPFYRVQVPEQHKDLNDWVRAGASSEALRDAIETADLLEPQKADPGQGNPPFTQKLAQEQNGDAGEKPIRPMPSWISYGNQDIDPSQYHVGEGFLEVGGFVMVIGQSYVGKSTLLAQVSINLSIGRSWLFFQVQRPLRVLTIQAEDQQNKLRKMGKMYRRMELTEEQIALANENTAVLTIRDLQDQDAINEIERHAQIFKADVLCINPMTSYVGSVYKDEAINRFLRVGLTPTLDRLKMSAIVAHHPPKPATSDKEPKDLTAFELQYGGAGMAALTNAPRGNIFLVHVDGDVFKLSVGKGFEDLGTKETVVFLRRSKDEDGIMLWQRCEPEKAEEATEKLTQRRAKKQHDRFVPYDRLLKSFKPTAKYLPSKVIELAKKDHSKGRDWAKDAMRQLVSDKKLAKTEERSPRGQPFVYYHLPTLLEPATGD